MAEQRYKTVNGMKIPVGEDGYVPESALLKRYKKFYDAKQEEYDDRRLEARLEGRKMPAMNLAKHDYDNTSDVVVPLKCTPEQVAAWWADPSSADVQDIDTQGAPKVNVPAGMTPAQQRDQGHIKVVATPSEEQKVRRELVMTYTPEELHKFAATRPTIAVKPTSVSNTGRYVPSRKRIELDRTDGMEQTTIVHEGGHHLRATDPDRRDPIVRSNSSIGIEESCTVAEQQARSDKVDYNGYYQNVAVYDEEKHRWRKPTLREARRMAEEDHALFTAGRNKGLKGDEALRSVEENWSKSHISRLRYGSNTMAINEMADQYGNVERISMAKPKSTAKAESAATVGVTNATAGRPGVVAASASKSSRQTTLFRRRRWPSYRISRGAGSAGTTTGNAGRAGWTV